MIKAMERVIADKNMHLLLAEFVHSVKNNKDIDRHNTYLTQMKTIYYRYPDTYLRRMFLIS